MDNHGSITFQFISEPSDVNYGGKVHGGEVMKWIDQTAYPFAIGLMILSGILPYLYFKKKKWL